MNVVGSVSVSTVTPALTRFRTSNEDVNSQSRSRSFLDPRGCPVVPVVPTAQGVTVSQVNHLFRSPPEPRRMKTKEHGEGTSVGGWVVKLLRKILGKHPCTNSPSLGRRRIHYRNDTPSTHLLFFAPRYLTAAPPLMTNDTRS